MMQGPWTCQKQQVIPDMPQSQRCFWQSCVCRVGQGTQPSPSLPPQPLDRSPPRAKVSTHKAHPGEYSQCSRDTGGGPGPHFNLAITEHRKENLKYGFFVRERSQPRGGHKLGLQLWHEVSCPCKTDEGDWSTSLC